MEFRHQRIDSEPPGSRQVSCLTTDLTGNGRDDVIIGASKGEQTLYWYENPGWERHDIANPLALEAGGVLADLTRNGRLDIVMGAPRGDTANLAYWFEQPLDPRDEWAQHVIVDEYHKYHDQAYGDVDDDGNPELVFLSQDAEAVFYYDIPKNPTIEPWPDENRHVVAEDKGDIEGLAIVDIDGDGRTELVAGRHVFHRQDDDNWIADRVAPEWKDERVRLAVEDVDNDGDYEILIAECELPALGERHDIYHDGRFAICEPPKWDPTVLRDDLHCPHSLQVADFDGDGKLDIFVAESGFGGNENPEHYLFRNNGDGAFEEHCLEKGIAIHEAKVADLTGEGGPDIVGKNDGEVGHVDVWYNEA